jgi:O-antigen/teichoic acid export membrane protein
VYSKPLRLTRPLGRGRTPAPPSQASPSAPRRLSVRPLVLVLRDPMLRNGYALVLSASVSQLIGILYWVIAARSYPAAVVGRNSAAISITVFLAGLAELNLMSTLVRFLPISGTRSARLILTVYAASASVAALAGLCFVVLISRIEPQLGFLRSSPFLVLWFVVSVITGAIFVLQDSALTGVRAAPFVPLENGGFSLVKLALMFPLMRLLPTAGIYLSWTAAFAISVIPTNAYLFFRAVPRHLRAQPPAAEPPRFSDIRSYMVPDSLAGYCMLACTTGLPLLIIDRLGPAAAGHYALAWVIGFSLYLVSLNMGSSLTVETSADQSKLRDRCLRCITHQAKLLVPAVVLIIATAPYLLMMFGSGYAAADVGALRLLALAALPALITNTAISVTRSQRRMRVVAGIQVSICVLMWGLSALLIGPLGITGVGAAWLIAQGATAAALVAWPRFWLPAGRRPRHARPARKTGRRPGP